MKIATLAAALLLTSCADSPEPVRGDLATFDGEWGPSYHCTAATNTRCDLPWGLVALRAKIDRAVLMWIDGTDLGAGGPTIATHRGDVLDGCLSVAAGLDGDLTHDAYDLCPVDGATPREITGVIVWGRGTVGECHCDVTLREQP